MYEGYKTIWGRNSHYRYSSDNNDNLLCAEKRKGQGTCRTCLQISRLTSSTWPGMGYKNQQCFVMQLKRSRSYQPEACVSYFILEQSLWCHIRVNVCTFAYFCAWHGEKTHSLGTQTQWHTTNAPMHRDAILALVLAKGLSCSPRCLFCSRRWLLYAIPRGRI